MSDYYTVTEYAVLVGKDTGNIRRLLIEGVIEGEKFGRLWMVPKSTEYPEDRRMKSGYYRNWRKRMEINSKCPGLLNSLTEMSGRLGKIYGKYLEKVVLYGSYARAEQTEDSDIDIAILVREGSTDKMHDEMQNIVIDYELDLATTLSVIPINVAEYFEWRKDSPLFRNIEKEGIVLWKAA